MGNSLKLSSTRDLKDSRRTGSHVATIVVDRVDGSYTVISNAKTGKINWVSDDEMKFLIGKTESELWLIGRRMGWYVYFGN